MTPVSDLCYSTGQKVGLWRTLFKPCDRRIMRYMAGVSLRDRVRSEEVARRCGMDEVEAVMRERRLRWFGHVRRREEDNPVRRVMDLEVNGRRPPGRPKKTWAGILETHNERFTSLTRRLRQKITNLNKIVFWKHSLSRCVFLKANEVRAQCECLNPLATNESIGSATNYI